MQKRSLAGIVETEEEELRVLVQQAEGGEDIVDYSQGQKAHVSDSLLLFANLRMDRCGQARAGL